MTVNRDACCILWSIPEGSRSPACGVERISRMASMERRVRNGKTTWRVVWRDPQGKKKSKTFPNEGTPKNPGAKQFKAEIEQALNTGNYYDSSRGKITVGEWAQVWLESKGDLKASSKERYAGIIRTHIDP